MNKKVFIGIGIFWLLIIFGFVAFKEFTLQTGEEILLKTQPVDPRDLFRGDYIILSYDMGTLDVNTLDSDSMTFEINDNVYVTLNKKDNYGVPAGIYKNKPDKELFIKGKIKNNETNRLTIEYGIESYFVPEGKGIEIERQLGRNLDVKVSIDKFGNAVIKSLLIDSKVVSFD